MKILIELGQLIDNRYQIIKEIGSGGGGIIYQAHDTRLNKLVVVKLIKDCVKHKLDNRREVDILKKLRHSYLPQVYDFLEIDGYVFTVLDFIEGNSFDVELRQGRRFSQKQVIKWGRQLTEALVTLHQQKPAIIHSDIKPANIMHTITDDICLIDFNISLIFDKKSLNALGRTDGYAAPEQYCKSDIVAQIEKKLSSNPNSIRISTSGKEILEVDFQKQVKKNIRPNIKLNKNRKVDERSDIYSLGATLYHLVTGVKPGISYQPIKHLDEFTDLRVSEGLRFIIMKAMDPDPKKRFQSAVDMLNAFSKIHKYDRRYKAFIFKREIAIISIVGLAAISTISIKKGMQLLGEEKLNQYENLLILSQDLNQAGDYEASLEKLETAIAMYPKKFDGYHQYALTLYDNGHYEDCITLVENYLSNQMMSESGMQDIVKNGDVMFLTANCYFELEDYKSANMYFQRAINLNNKNPEYYRDYAIALARTNQVKEAREVIEQAKIIGLNEIDITLVEGEIYLTEQLYPEAETTFKNALMNTTDAEIRKRTYQLLSRVYKSWATQMDDSIRKEVELLEQAVLEFPLLKELELNEMLADAYVRQANQLQDDSYLMKAIKVFEDIINSGYDRFHIHQNIAILYQQVGNLAKAQQYLLAMSEKYPDDYRVDMRLAFLESDIQYQKSLDQRDYTRLKGYYDKAITKYEKAKKRGTTDSQMSMLDDFIEELKTNGWLK